MAHASQLDEEGSLAVAWNKPQENVTSSMSAEVELNLGNENETLDWMKN